MGIYIYSKYQGFPNITVTLIKLLNNNPVENGMSDVYSAYRCLDASGACLNLCDTLSGDFGFNLSFVT